MVSNSFFQSFLWTPKRPSNFQERVNKTLEFEHTAWLSHKPIVTKGHQEKHEMRVCETMTTEKSRIHAKPKQVSESEIEQKRQKIDQT